MLVSLAVVFLGGFAMAALCQRIGLPRIIGMLLLGILAGPFAAGLLDPSLLSVSAQLRRIALVIILVKAGLSLKVTDLKKVGRPALLMSFVPAVFEILGCVVLAPSILGCTRVEAAILGAVLGAVSPAVVVPRMVQLMDEKWGTREGIPQLLLAGASLDDVFVIVLFEAFVAMGQGEALSALRFARIPAEILLGILLGAAAGWLLAVFFRLMDRRAYPIPPVIRTLILLSVAFLLTEAENIVPASGLLAVMSMATALQMNSPQEKTEEWKQGFSSLWTGAEVLLFVLVGAAVDIRYTLNAGPAALLLILLVLVIRSLGVVLSVASTALNKKERLFCVFSYLPKATVQAAIGGVPLALGLACGDLVLSVAVLSILITAPLGAFCMDRSYRRLLQREVM